MRCNDLAEEDKVTFSAIAANLIRDTITATLVPHLSIKSSWKAGGEKVV